MDYVEQKKLLPQLHDITVQVINLKDKRFSSWIHERNFQYINLGKTELEATFLSQILTDETKMSYCDKYLNLLRRDEKEKLQSLEHEKGFDIDEVFESFSEGLKENYQHYGAVLAAHEHFKYELGEERDYLDVLLEQPYFKTFCDGLELTYAERCFFLLNFANKEWGWLFPSQTTDAYKTKLFTSISRINISDNTSITRKLNNSMIAKGLFSEEWEVQDYVYAFFCGKIQSFNLHKVERNFSQTVYDNLEIERINDQAIRIVDEQLEEYLENQKGCRFLLTGKNDYITGLFTAHFCDDKKITLYEVEQQMDDADKREMIFYMYALSVMIQGKRKAFYFSRDNTGKLLASSESEGNTIRIVNNGNGGRSRSRCSLPANYLLSKIKIPIIFSTDQSSSEAKKKLEELGLDVLFSTELKLPEVYSYSSWAGNFFYKQKAPEALIHVAVDFCQKLKLQPEYWDKLAEVLNNATGLSQDQVELLLENKFGDSAKDGNNIRKNSHYCLEALNTTESVQDLIKAVKNAEKYQEHEYDDESGIRICLTGPSGTGKTAFAEQTAKEIGCPLHVVRASDILDSYVGQTEKNIKAAFEKAKEEHAVLLIDEADSFIHERGDKVNHHNDSKVNEFLVQMERYPGVLFCNTNLPDILDKATDRRFHFKVGFKPLTKDGIGLLCKSYFERFDISEEQVNQIFSSGDVTPGDFGALNGKLRFMDADKLNAEFITNELCRLVHSKERSWENRTVGFSM